MVIARAWRAPARSLPEQGAAAIAKIANISWYFGMPEFLEILVAWMRDSVIPGFAPYVRRE